MCYNHFTLETKAGRQKSAIPGGRMDGARQHALQSRAVLRLKEDRTPSVLILGLRRGLFGWLKKFASLNGNSVRRSLAGVPHHSGRAEISRLCAYGRASLVHSRQDQIILENGFMRKLAVGILAHVDAGKTTLSEGIDVYKRQDLDIPRREAPLCLHKICKEGLDLEFTPRSMLFIRKSECMHSPKKSAEGRMGRCKKLSLIHIWAGRRRTDMERSPSDGKYGGAQRHFCHCSDTAQICPASLKPSGMHVTGAGFNTCGNFWRNRTSRFAWSRRWRFLRQTMYWND